MDLDKYSYIEIIKSKIHGDILNKLNFSLKGELIIDYYALSINLPCDKDGKDIYPQYECFRLLDNDEIITLVYADLGFIKVKLHNIDAILVTNNDKIVSGNKYCYTEEWLLDINAYHSIIKGSMDRRFYYDTVGFCMDGNFYVDENNNDITLGDRISYGVYTSVEIERVINAAISVFNNTVYPLTKGFKHYFRYIYRNLRGISVMIMIVMGIILAFTQMDSYDDINHNLVSMLFYFVLCIITGFILRILIALIYAIVNVNRENKY